MSDTYQAVRDAIAAADDEWGEETGDGNANPTYLDQLAKAADAAVRAALEQARAQAHEARMAANRNNDRAAEQTERCEMAEEQRDRLSLLLRGMARRVAKWRADYFRTDERWGDQCGHLRARLAKADELLVEAWREANRE